MRKQKILIMDEGRDIGMNGDTDGKYYSDRLYGKRQDDGWKKCRQIKGVDLFGYGRDDCAATTQEY